MSSSAGREGARVLSTSFSLVYSSFFSSPLTRSHPSPASTWLPSAACSQAGNIGDILKSSCIVSSIHRPRRWNDQSNPVRRERLSGADIPVSNAAENGRSFRAMMRPDTHILVNIFNRVSDRRDVREISSQSSRTNSARARSPFSSYNNVDPRLRDLPYFRARRVRISLRIPYRSKRDTPPHATTALLRVVTQCLPSENLFPSFCLSEASESVMFSEIHHVLYLARRTERAFESARARCRQNVYLRAVVR